MNKKLMSKINLSGHFTSGKIYNAVYDFDGKGWFTIDDSDTLHWLSPNDNKDRSNIKNEKWILDNFYIID